MTGDTRNLARTFIRAVRFLFSRPLALAGLYLPVLLLLGLLPLLYGLGLAPYLPPGLWPLTLAAQQLFILAVLWTSPGPPGRRRGPGAAIPNMRSSHVPGVSKSD